MLDRSRVRELFGEAAELPGDRVAGFLDRACSGDAVLRREVESLLSAASVRPAFLGAPTASPAGVSAGPSGETVGMTIGRYRLLEEIGHGGFGTVYMAEQSEPVRRRVAFKIIKLGMDTRAVITRFEAERQALAMMDHTNIARVFDAGATESGRPYFVMELVRGEAITAYCDRNNLSIPERLGVFVQVCHAVQHAHSKGVIHRDLKPGNVLVATEDGRPHVKVIDFGIAKATRESLTEKTLFTEFRQLIGTPEYMSPEQAEGSFNVDTRTDVYSLGVLLYELLTGATPFDAKSLRSAAYGEIQRIIREVEPLKPSTRVSTLGDAMAAVASKRRTEPGRLSPLLQGDLDWVVMKCLEKDRGRRYGTSDALGADLTAFLRGDAVSAVPPSAVYRARKFAARNRGLVIGAVAVLGVLLLGMMGTTWGMLSAWRAERGASRERNRATAVSGFLTGTFEGVSPQVARGRDTELLGAMMDSAAARVESGELTGNPEAEGELRIVIGEVYAELARFDEAGRLVAVLGSGESLAASLRLRLQLLRAELALAGSRVEEMEGWVSEAQRLLDAQPRPDPKLTLAVLSCRAEVALAKNMVDEAAEIDREAVRVARTMPQPDRELIAQRLHQLGVVLNRQGNERGALEAWGEALKVLAELPLGSRDTLDSPTRIEILVSRAGLFAQRLEPEMARADLGEARRVGGRMFPQRHPTMMDVHYSLANMYLHTGKQAEALSEFQVLLAIRREVFGNESLQAASALDSIAEVHYLARRWLPSLEAATEAERIRGKHLTREACAARGGWTTVANCLCRLGRVDEALSLARRSIELQRSTLQPESEEGMTGIATFMGCLYAANRLQEVVTEGRGLLARYGRGPGDPLPVLELVQMTTAAALLDMGEQRDLAECERLLRACLERRLQRFSDLDPRVAFARTLLGQAIAAQLISDAPTGDSGDAALAHRSTLERLREAESLIASSLQTVVDNLERLDAGIRVKRVSEAGAALVALYERWDRFEPGMDKRPLATEWRARLDRLVRSIESGTSPGPDK